MTRKLPYVLALAGAMLIGAGRGQVVVPSSHEIAPRNSLGAEMPASARATVAHNVFGVLLEDGTFAHYFNY